MAHLKAPWTPEQVTELNLSQTARNVHPFTCGGTVPRRDHPDGEGVLTATPDGWVCHHCGYTQDWCHDWMATAEGRK